MKQWIDAITADASSSRTTLIIGYRPSSQGETEQAERRAIYVKEKYSADDARLVIATVDDSTLPPHPRHRVVTRLVRPP